MSPLSADGLILDAGNTLVFLDATAAAQVLTDIGHPLPAAALTRAMGAAHRGYTQRLGAGGSHEDGWRRFMRVWLTEAGLEPEALDEAVTSLRREHDRFNLWRRLPPEVPGSLARARRAGLRLGIISNSEGRLTRLLGRLDLLEPFDVILDSGVEGLEKPDPALFHRATERLALPPERCLYAGDLPEVDVAGARRAGLGAALIDALGLHPDYDEAPKFASVADLIDAMIAVG